MERDTNQMSQNPSLCRSGCGFYGNPSSDGLCSKCYKDALKRKQAAPTATPSSIVGPPSSANLDSNSNMLSFSSITSSVSPSSTPSTVPCPLSAITAQESSHSQVEIKIDSNVELPNDCKDVGSSAAAGDASVCLDQSNNSETASSTPETLKTQKKKRTKCAQCKANVGVISFPCRCGGIFCGTHRYASEHRCTFDYKEHGAEEIRKNNPQVIGEKVQKI